MSTINQTLGRLTSFSDKIWRLIKPTRARVGDGFESTGVHIDSNGAIPNVIKDDGIVFVDYDNESHKLWRSQEFSLIQQNLGYFQKPVLDLGCGDGSFSKVLFNNIEYGVDPDAIALSVAEKLGLYSNLINCLAEKTDLQANSIGTVFSNSVLEHTHNLFAIIQEVQRILKPGGIFIFTVPNNSFTTSIEKYFGVKEAARLNREVFFHHNLFSNNEWREALNNNGFEIVVLQNYQFERFNYVFRMLRSPFVKHLNRYLGFWDNKYLISLVKKSLSQNEGAGTFIIAKKK